MRLITTGVVVAILALVTVLARREGGEPPEDPGRPSYRMPRAYPAVFRVCAAGFLLGAAFCAYTLYKGNPTAAGPCPSSSAPPRSAWPLPSTTPAGAWRSTMMASTWGACCSPTGACRGAPSTP